MDLASSTALVTGGASGLGKAVVEAFAAKGARVIILDLPSSKGAEVANALGERVGFAAGDVTKENEVQAAVDAAVSRFGGLSVLVNCAGIGTAMRTLAKDGPAKLEAFSKVIQVNLIGTFNCIRLAAAAMQKNTPSADGERGVIINTASVAAFEGQIGQVAYSASKAGIVGMTLPVARDLSGIGIRCVTLAPGIFDTPLLASLPDDVKRSLGEQVPFPKRLGRPEELAALATHVVENVMLNGEVIRLDGAIRMGPR